MSVEMCKSLVTVLILLLAAMQALSMAQVRGYVNFLPWGKKRLLRFHRWGGISALILALAVAVVCVLGEGYVLYSPRIWAHAVMGSLAILALFLKISITHRFRRQLRYNTAVGAVAGLLILGASAASALWYLVGEVG